jgi:hypothetical protein
MRLQLIRTAISSALIVAILFALPTNSDGQNSKRSRSGGKAVAQEGAPRDFRSQRFLVHADLSDAEAKELLLRLEKMYDLVGAYWGRRLKPGQIVEMFVVKDLKNWPAGAIPTDGLSHIQSGGGVTQTQSVSQRGPQGERLHVDARTICFAVYENGTPLHEAVHAFCGLTFGHAGPTWYSEGMAEMGSYWKEKDTSVQLEPVVLQYLQSNSVKSLNAIINNSEQTGDSWQNYSWRWAICHMLANNPNYREKFRPLGLDLLTERPNSFENVYGAMSAEISFEYKHFIATIDNGYRVDLAAIDWKKKFLPVHGRAIVTSSIQAVKGWQPTQALVVPEKKYAFSTTGKWTTAKGAPPVSAAGDAQGAGQLLAAILSKESSGEYVLSDPIRLGDEGSFTPPVAGKLLVRCQDAWNSLADNQGRVTLKIKLAD